MQWLCVVYMCVGSVSMQWLCAVCMCVGSVSMQWLCAVYMYVGSVSMQWLCVVYMCVGSVGSVSMQWLCAVYMCVGSVSMQWLCTVYMCVGSVSMQWLCAVCMCVGSVGSVSMQWLIAVVWCACSTISELEAQLDYERLRREKLEAQLDQYRREISYLNSQMENMQLQVGLLFCLKHTVFSSCLLIKKSFKKCSQNTQKVQVEHLVIRQKQDKTICRLLASLALVKATNHYSVWILFYFIFLQKISVYLWLSSAHEGTWVFETILHANLKQSLCVCHCFGDLDPFSVAYELENMIQLCIVLPVSQPSICSTSS